MFDSFLHLNFLPFLGLKIIKQNPHVLDGHSITWMTLVPWTILFPKGRAALAAKCLLEDLKFHIIQCIHLHFNFQVFLQEEWSHGVNVLRVVRFLKQNIKVEQSRCVGYLWCYWQSEEERCIQLATLDYQIYLYQPRRFFLQQSLCQQRPVVLS